MTNNFNSGEAVREMIYFNFIPSLFRLIIPFNKPNILLSTDKVRPEAKLFIGCDQVLSSSTHVSLRFSRTQHQFQVVVFSLWQGLMHIYK